MKIGILSDSHGKAGRVRRALAELIQRGAEQVVHCGDVGSVECVAALAEAGVQAYLVAGNMDRHPEKLAKEAARTGVHFSEGSVVVPLAGGGRLAVTHGNDTSVIAKLLADPQVRYICQGHTHNPRDERIGEKRIINPGALRHTRQPSVALLDTDTDTLELIEVR